MRATDREKKYRDAQKPFLFLLYKKFHFIKKSHPFSAE